MGNKCVSGKANESSEPLKKINGYSLLEEIGSGSYGTVFRVESIDKRSYAMKLIRIKEEDKNYALNEAGMYLKFNHPNLLKGHSFSLYNEERILAVVLDYCQNGNLTKLIGKVNEVESEKMIEQITEGIAYLHDNKIVHRDIKPQNIMMLNGVPKIGDFGFSKIIKESGLSSKVGTLHYIAPEVLNNEKYHYQVDIWSLGILFFELLSGKRIFHIVEGLSPALRNDFPSENMLKLIKSYKYRKIVSQMLQKNPSDRPNAKQLLNKLHDIIDENYIIEKMTEDQIIDLISNVSFFPNLIILDLRSSNITNERVKALVGAAHKFPNLQLIDFDKIRITYEGIKALADSENKFVNLKSLHLNENRIKDSGLKALAAGSQFKALQTIVLGSNQITDKGLKAFFLKAKNFSNLQVIGLRDNKITNEGVKELVAAANHYSRLRYIGFYRNRIKDQGLKTLVIAASKLSSLQGIDLGNNLITDIGIKTLCSSVSLFGNLQAADFSSNEITIQGLKAMVFVASKFSKLEVMKLEVINIYNNKMTSEQIKSIQIQSSSDNLKRFEYDSEEKIIKKFKQIAYKGLQWADRYK